jgi:CAI-1 autoinducer synthase
MEVVDRALPATRTQPGLSAKLRQRIANEFQSRWEKEWGAKFVTHGVPPGPNAVRLDGNDYLAITGHPQVVQAQLDALRREQEFIIQSGVFQLDGSPASQLQRALASWLGKEDGLLCQSGYTANLGLLQVIADPQTPIYLDGLAHMSLWEGARAAGAPSHGFRHNDPEHLSKMATRHGPGLVVVDSVYSTTGAVARLAELVEVAEQHECMMVVDESHSLGTHGPGGAGLCAMLGLTDRVHFITASLAKAFAGRAGFFTMPVELRPYLMCHSYPSIFSSCLLPHEVAGLAATLDVVKRGDEARQRLHANTRRVRAAFKEAGYPIDQGTEQIISLEAGTESDTLALRDALESRGVFGAVFCAPATSRNRAMVRLTLNAALTDAEMAHVAAVAKELAPHVKPWDWPIAKRQASRAA